MLLAMRADNGKTSCRKDGYLFVLSHRITVPVPTDGTETEYMITDALGTHPKGLVVEPVTEQHQLVPHLGFECAGSMCSTTAYTIDSVLPGWLTPGRVQDLLPIAHNVNVGWNGQERRPLTPGSVYVTRGENRAAGIPTVASIHAGNWHALVSHRKRLADMRRTAASQAA